MNIQTKESTRRVTVRDFDTPFSYLDKDNEERVLGFIRTSSYGNDNMKKFAFAPVEENPFARPATLEKGVTLGRGSGELAFVNFADAQRPLVDAGWTMKDMYQSRAGAEMVATYIREDLAIEDPWSWDAQMWVERVNNMHGGHGGMNALFPTVRLRMSLTPDRLGAHYQMGLFRQVCTNGLIIPVMDMWELRVRHIEKDQEGMIAALNAFNDNPDVIVASQEMAKVSTKPVADRNGLKRATEIIQGYRKAQREAKAEGEELPTRWQIFKTQYPTLSETSTPGWALDNYETFLDALVTGEDRDDFHMVDLMNAYTSGINHRRLVEDNQAGTWWAHDMADRVTLATASIATMATLFGN